ncbi:hypothetical protein [Shewanella amazonensis]|uniref:hypothetical protein n=1 Tax=Shewanella amazonensis TaxID=60478 RepID=UPI0012FB7EA7|nr:hypothetical protein [Shewanella amazonensis]
MKSACLFQPCFDFGKANKTCHLSMGNIGPDFLTLKVTASPVLTGFVLFLAAARLHCVLPVNEHPSMVICASNLSFPEKGLKQNPLQGSTNSGKTANEYDDLPVVGPFAYV